MPLFPLFGIYCHKFKLRRTLRRGVGVQLYILAAILFKAARAYGAGRRLRAGKVCAPPARRPLAESSLHGCAAGLRLVRRGTLSVPRYTRGACMDLTAFFTMTSGLYVVSAEAEGQKAGCVINTAVQVTATPPKYPRRPGLPNKKPL